jgi:hypothetical protein
VLTEAHDQFFLILMCGLLQGEAVTIFESSDQKTRVFLIQIKLTPCSPVHTHKLFSEISVRT